MLSPPVKLTADHDFSGFDCGDPSINTYLTKRALKNQNNDFGVTYVVANDQGLVVGYYTIAMSNIYHINATRILKRNAPDPIPMLLMARLGVTQAMGGRGIGFGMVKDFFLRGVRLSEEVAIKGFLVNALNERALEFWQKVGLKPSPNDDLTMMISLKEVRSSMAAAHPATSTTQASSN